MKDDAMEIGQILLIDDDADLRQLLSDYLGKDGYQVTTAADGKTGLKLALSGAHSLILLDVMLPHLDGFAFVRELRKSSAVPVIMLTAKGEDIDRIVGLELGADDYLPKPFNPRELTARIKAVLRRGSFVAQGGATFEKGKKLVCGDLVVDLQGYSAILGSKPLALTAVELGLLGELMLASGRVLTRDTLLDRVRGKDFELFDRSIDVHISHLRQKLNDDVAHPRFIRTVRSVGYMFIDGVNETG